MARQTLFAFFLLTGLFCTVFISMPDWAVQMKSWILPLLIGVMLTMGLTLSWQDFRQIAGRPIPLAVGVVGQFLLMPFFAWILAEVFGLPALLAAGLILVGASPGGTASNLITYLSGGNTALSVTMTAISTLLSLALTPLIIHWYLGESIGLNPWEMVRTLLLAVIAPVVLGIFLARILRLDARRAGRIATPAAMTAIALIIGIVAGLNSATSGALLFGLFAAVMLHNLLGLLSGYLLGRLFGQDEVTSRTLAIEIGMQNSGLAVVLALKYFTPASAAAGAIFSLWHNISGMAFAYFSTKKGSGR